MISSILRIAITSLYKGCAKFYNYFILSDVAALGIQ